jgi:hypothetical protein
MSKNIKKKKRQQVVFTGKTPMTKITWIAGVSSCPLQPVVRFSPEPEKNRKMTCRYFF